MNAHDTVDAAIHEIENLRKVLKKKKTAQVSSRDELDLVKATAMAWFHSHLPTIKEAVGEDASADIHEEYHLLLGFSDRSTTRTKYDVSLKKLKKLLAGLRKHVVDGVALAPPTVSTDAAPDFTPLIADPKMQAILVGRWNECALCLAGGAPLAATVMMGGLLETLMLSRFNHETDTAPVFAAVTAPKDRKTGKTQQLQEWTLRHYLDVGHELGWISRSTKDVGEVVRDFRNYIHPYKQISHNVTVDANDARLFWEITKEISRQLLDKVKK